jgi:hypothetical protein
VNSFHLDSGCTNPPNLNTTAFIDTAASKHLVTPTTKTSPATSSERITVIQPGSNKMHTTHAFNLLLSIPPYARMAHFLPGLTNNLLSVPVLVCDTGFKVFLKQECVWVYIVMVGIDVTIIASVDAIEIASVRY